MTNLLPRPALVGLALCLAQPADAANAARPTALSPPPKLGLCASCHNVDGIATLPAHPHLAGQDADYLRLSVAKYVNGERNHAPMRAAVSALTQKDLDRIIDYYAELPRDGGRP